MILPCHRLTMEAPLNVLVLDGHPDEHRLVSSLLDHYAASLQPGSTVRRIAVRDLAFDPNLRRGYSADQAWEPDLERVGVAISECDHLVVGFPLWWGGEPGLLKGLLDRLILPGFAFRYHADDPFWDSLLAGRSADVVVTMDTPPWYLRAIYGDPVSRRWRRQVLVRLAGSGDTVRLTDTEDLRWHLNDLKRVRISDGMY